MKKKLYPDFIIYRIRTTGFNCRLIKPSGLVIKSVMLYVLKQLGSPNQIVDNSKSDCKEFGQRNMSDSKSNSKL